MTKQDDDDHRECRECERLRAALRKRYDHLQWLSDCTAGDHTQLRNATWSAMSDLREEFIGAVADIDAALDVAPIRHVTLDLPGAPAEPPVTRQQAEDRSEPPATGYAVEGCRWTPYLAVREWHESHEAAVAACWAHRDAVREKVEREIADWAHGVFVDYDGELDNVSASEWFAARIRRGAYRKDGK